MKARSALAVAALASVVSACGSADAGSDILTVYAAASLKAPFTEIAERFEEANPGISVELSFAGSSDLVAQLEQGAPADVFASADTRTMDLAVADGLLGSDPVAFATNTLTIVTEAGNPKNIRSVADLAVDQMSVVVCAPQVPCGAAAARLGDAAGVDLTPVSEESSVTDVLGKVASGQADAGLVYVTDAVGAGGDVTAVAVPEAAEIVNVYPVATLADGRNPAAAADFVRYVTGDEARSVLGGAGFGTP